MIHLSLSCGERLELFLPSCQQMKNYIRMVWVSRVGRLKPDEASMCPMWICYGAFQQGPDDPN
jgi:hypothetical protein